MPAQAPFSCLVVGEGSMPIQCGAILLERGHAIRGVLSDDPAVRRWAADHGLRHMGFDGDIMAFASQEPVDYLFSIVNPRLLPQAMLDLPRRLAINYHDAPLPRYAGVHATYWALLNRESRHAISWHVMVEEADAGAIVKQVPVEIAPDETSVTLNAKCYATAIDAFADMVDELAADRALLREQDLTRRTYVGLHDRPPAGGLLAWAQPAAALDALGRASDFGTYRNRVGVPKVLLGAEPLAVTRLRARAAAAGAAPGTVLAIDDGGIEVAVADGIARLAGLVTLDGRPLTPAEAARTGGLRVGSVLATPPAALAERVTAYDVEARRQEMYWVRRIAALDPLTLAPLPTSDGRRDSPDEARVEMPLADLALPEGAPAASTVAAAFACALYLLHGTPRFDIGVSAEAPGLEGLDRLYAPDVPLRVDLGVDVAASDALERVRAELARRRARRSYLRDVVLRHPELNGLAQQGTGAQLPILIREVDRLADWSPPPGTQLALVISEREEMCVWHFDPATLDRAAVAGMREALAAILHAVREEPARPLGTVPLVTERERERVLALGGARRAHPAQGTLAALLEEQADRSPSALAVKWGDERLTYAELNARGNRVAHALLRRGVGPESRVGVFMERSLEMVVTLVGIVKAGAAYVPLDPSYPAPRLEFMMQDSAMHLVLTERARMERLPSRSGDGDAVEVLAVEEVIGGADATEASSANPTGVPVQPHNLAYVMYTSGSTGTPKGVAVEQRNIVRLVRDTDYVTFGPTDRIAQASNMSFDAATFEIWGALLNGGAIVGLAREVTLTPSALAAALRDEGITHLWLTVALFNQIARELPDAFGGVRYLLTGGDALDPVTIRMVLGARTPPANLLNGYGPTENTTFSAVHRIASVPEGATTVPIGRPIAHSTLVVLNASLEPVPAGVPGELYVGGAGVARGYLARPAMTAERFVPDPFSPERGARLYRTGDLVRWNARGEMEFLGRIDQQVKIRGFRIELGEIEAALAGHPSVRECVVIARAVANGKQLVAYVVPAEGRTAAPGELREHLASALPEYMVPAAFVSLPQLPVTPNGKLDRRALPAPSDEDTSGGQEVERARDLAELQLTGIWERLLSRRGIGIHEDFFALGGHSLLAVAMFAEIEKLFGKRLPMVTLFEAPTIAQLAVRVRGADDELTWPALVPLQAAGDRPPLFLLPGGGGNLLPYRHLISHLPPDQPSYGLQPPSLAGSVGHFETIEELAARYVEEIVRVQPSGPYHLKGWCIGGVVAMEIAQQLQARGEEVAYLAMVDSTFPGVREVSLGERLRYYARRARGLGLLGGLRYLAGQAVHVVAARIRRRRVAARNAAMQAPTAAPAASSIPRQRLEEHIVEMDLILTQRYRPKPYHGHVTLIWPDDKPEESYVDSRAEWAQLASGDVEHVVLRGSHHTLYDEPQVRDLARTLTSTLSRAQQREGAAPVVAAQKRPA